MATVSLTVNGKAVSATVEDRTLLVTLLRGYGDDLPLIAAKICNLTSS